MAVVVVWLILLVIYFTPTLSSFGRVGLKKVFLANVFLGWTVLGWFVVLLWGQSLPYAVSDVREERLCRLLSTKKE